MHTDTQRTHATYNNLQLYALLLCPHPQAGALSNDAVWRLSVWHLSVMYIGPKSRTVRPRNTKIGTEVAWLGHHFQGQKVKGQGHRGRGHIVADSRLQLVSLIFIQTIRNFQEVYIKLLLLINYYYYNIIIKWKPQCILHLVQSFYLYISLFMWTWCILLERHILYT